jgi:PhzF family phenazine biosynthesis protein
MTYPIYQIDAFTSELFKGNPASVIILDKWLPSSVMQNIAMENNLPETAFITPIKGELHIRWFTPTIEVDLCGHATLAASYVLFNHEDLEGDEITFHSKSGLLRVSRNNDELILDFPLDDIYRVNEMPELMKFKIRQLVSEVYRGKDDYMFILENQQQIEDFIPPFEIIEQLDARGLIITAPGNEVDFVSRYFSPQSGIPEDPVTGSAHTTLSSFWSKRLGKNKMTAQQLSKRGGKLVCEIRSSRVFIGGSCRTFFKGQLVPSREMTPEKK